MCQQKAGGGGELLINVNMHRNITGFKIFLKSPMQMFLDEGNTCNTFIKPQENTQCVLVRKTECKHNLFVYKKTQ